MAGTSPRDIVSTGTPASILVSMCTTEPNATVCIHAQFFVYYRTPGRCRTPSEIRCQTNRCSGSARHIPSLSPLSSSTRRDTSLGRQKRVSLRVRNPDHRRCPTEWYHFGTTTSGSHKATGGTSRAFGRASRKIESRGAGEC